MRRTLWRCARSQDGFTLVEVVITSVLALIVMSGLTSIILTATRANDIASSRVEASGQIRNFELRAYDDFAQSAVPDPSNCIPPPGACSIVLSNSITRTPRQSYLVTYTWNGTPDTSLDRVAPVGHSTHMATNVTKFSWALAGSAPNQTVVVTLTVTVRSYAETQTFLFYPRVNW